MSINFCANPKQGDQLDPSSKRLDRMSLFAHRDDDRWNAVIFLWAGLAPITDVESFVYSCNDVGNFELAYGIVFDQYERFLIEIRRGLLFDLFTDKCKSLKLKTDGQWICGKPLNDEGMLDAQNLQLRGLGSGVTLERLLSNAAMDGSISWEDIHSIRVPIRDMWWTACVCYAGDLSSLANCVFKRIPQRAIGQDTGGTGWLKIYLESFLVAASKEKFE
jgi:hypothetical protein